MHGYRADERKAKLEMSCKPLALEAVARTVQIGRNIFPIELHVIGQHEAVVQAGAPTDQFLPVWLAPKYCDESAHQQLLGEAHSRMGRHFESSQLEQTERGTGSVRRVELVDAKFGAVRAAGHVD